MAERIFENEQERTRRLIHEVADNLKYKFHSDFIFMVKGDYAIFTNTGYRYYFPCLSESMDDYYECMFDIHAPYFHVMKMSEPVALLGNGKTVKTENDDPFLQHARSNHTNSLCLFIPHTKIKDGDFLSTIFRMIESRTNDIQRGIQVLDPSAEPDPEIIKIRNQMRQDMYEQFMQYLVPLSGRTEEEFDKAIERYNTVQCNAENIMEEWLGKNSLELYKETNTVVIGDDGSHTFYFFGKGHIYAKGFIKSPAIKNIFYTFCCMEDRYATADETENPAVIAPLHPIDTIVAKVMHVAYREDEFMATSNFAGMAHIDEEKFSKLLRDSDPVDSINKYCFLQNNDIHEYRMRRSRELVGMANQRLDLRQPYVAEVVPVVEAVQ